MQRLSFSLLFSFYIALTCTAQEAGITASFSDTPMLDALRILRTEGGIKLAYDVNSMRALKVNADFQNTPIKEAFEQLLIDSGFEAVFIKNTWLIIPIEVPPARPDQELRRNLTVAGRLFDRNNGEPLPYANVAVRGMANSTISNLDGYFNLQEVKTDTVQLCISYIGYRSRCIRLQDIKDTEHINISLERAETYLPVIEVEDRRAYDLGARPGEDMMRMDANSISRISVGSQPDIFSAVKTLPGISSGDGLDAQLHIRGGNEDENLVQWDGFTLYHLDHFFGVFSTLNPSVIQQMQVFRSPYGSNYGGRSGGVLDIVGKHGNHFNWHTRVDMNLINASLLTEGPVNEKNRVLISFRRSHTDLVQSGFYKDLLDRVLAQSISNSSSDLVGQEQASDYHYHDFNFKWSSDLSTKDRLSFSLFNGGDSFYRTSSFRYNPEGPFVLNDIFEDDSYWGNTGLGAQWTRNRGQGKHQLSSVGWSQYRSDYYFLDQQSDFFNGIPQPVVSNGHLQRNEVRDLSFHHRRTTPLDNGHLDYGVQHTYLEVGELSTQRFLATSATRLVDSSRYSHQSSIYTDRHLMLPNTPWKLRYGGRISYNSYTNRLYIEPRGRIDYVVNKSTSLHIASGNYIQQIRRTTEQNLFLRQTDQWRLSDGERLPESRSFHSAVGVDWRWSALTVSAEIFHKRITGVIFNQEQNRLLSAYTAEREDIVQGSGTVSGLDLLLRWDKKAHSAWISYSYTLSENRLDEVNGGAAFPSPFNKPHDLQLVYNLRQTKYLFHLEGVASSGYPYTPVLGFFTGPSGDPFLVYGDDLSSRLPYLMRIDANLSRTFHFKNQDVSIGLGVYNLTNHKNIRGRSYALDQTRGNLADNLRIKAIDLELIGLSPTFSLVLDLR